MPFSPNKTFTSCCLVFALLLSMTACSSREGGQTGPPKDGPQPGQPSEGTPAVLEKEIQSRDSMNCGLKLGVTSISITADGTKAIASGSGTSDNVQLWDLKNKKQLQKFGTINGGRLPVAISADGKLAAYAEMASVVHLVDVATGAKQKRFSPKDTASGFPQSLQFTPAGDTLVLVTEKGISGWKISSGDVLFSLSFPDEERVTAASDLFDSGRKLATGSSKGVIRLWDLSSGKPTQKLNHDKEGVTALAVSADGKTLASACGYKEPIRVWNVTEGTVVRAIKTGKTASRPYGLALLQDGKLLAYPGDIGNAGTNFMIYVEDTATGQPRYRLDGHTRSVWGLAPLPGGSSLASVSEDDTIKVWDLK